jgi:hypothetical protein
MEWLKFLENRPELLVIAALTVLVIWCSFQLLTKIVDGLLAAQKEMAQEIKQANLTQVRICERLNEISKRENL